MDIINTGIREVQVIQVIQTLTTVGTGLEDDPVRAVWQYWTLKGELLATRDWGASFNNEHLT